MDIEICPKCKGVGRTLEYIESGNTYSNDKEYKSCSLCLGSGRRYINKFSYSFPFNVDIDVNEVYKIEKEILDLLKKIEKIK